MNQNGGGRCDDGYQGWTGGSDRLRPWVWRNCSLVDMDEAAPLQDNHPAPKGRTPVTLRVNSPGCIVRKNGLGSSDAGGGGGRPVKARGRGRQMTRGEHLHGTCSQLAYIDRSSAVRGTFGIIGCRPNITLSRHYSAPNPAAPCLRNLDLFFFFFLARNGRVK